MGQHNVFHVFPRGTFSWPGVLPGDGVVSPGCVAYRLEEFADRNPNTYMFSLAHAPLLVLAMCPYVPSSHEGPGELSFDEAHAYSTFVMLSRHGIICTVMKGKKRG